VLKLYKVRPHIKPRQLNGRCFYVLIPLIIVLFCCNTITLKRATSRFAHPEKFSLNFSSSSFVIRVNLVHP